MSLKLRFSWTTQTTCLIFPAPVTSGDCQNAAPPRGMGGAATPEHAANESTETMPTAPRSNGLTLEQSPRAQARSFRPEVPAQAAARSEGSGTNKGRSAAGPVLSLF